jgi:hypothetical protein
MNIARILGACLMIATLGGAAAVGRADADRAEAAQDRPTRAQWEYLVVAGGTTNLEPSGSSTMRKAGTGSFREAFVVETNLDKLGAAGWELVGVGGSPSDPVYYLKRLK